MTTTTYTATMGYKEIAERLSSCGLTPDTFGAVVKELIRDPLLLNKQQNPNPESPWQVGFNDALDYLGHVAGKVSAELAILTTTEPPPD